MISRRAYIAASVLAGSGAFAGLSAGLARRVGHPSRLSALEFSREGRAPTGTMIGEELDGRMFTDLSAIRSPASVTPVESFYVRTRASRLLPRPEGWKIRFSGPGHSEDVAAESLSREAASVGPCLMECAGNTRRAHFGLMSLADWSGVRLSVLMDNMGLNRPGFRTCVSGFDDYENPSATSTPGASWIFSAEELRASRAFLGTKMNGKPLTADHGAPVRLVVPGWYGCCCIKWVNRVTLVEDSCEATSQMKEYWSRTHQSAPHALAKDYEPARIELAAMPVRIEKWRTEAGIEYLVAGIAWGGPQPARAVQIQFHPGGEYSNVEKMRQQWHSAWAYWTHWWRPRAIGEYQIRLRARDPRLRTKRLDSNYYARSFEISQI